MSEAAGKGEPGRPAGGGRVLAWLMRLTPARIAVAYVVVSALWILLSDLALESLVGDGELFAHAQTVKGWFFVSVTGLFLYLLIVGFARQMSEVEAAEARRQARLQTIADHLPALISYVDAEERYVFANSAYGEWFGERGRDPVGRRVRDVYGDAAYAVVREHVAGALRGERRTFEGRLPCVGGTREVRALFVPDAEPGGPTRGYYVLMLDLTERQRAQSAIRESEERFRMVAKATADAVYDWNLETNSIWWSDGMQRLFGHGERDVGPGLEWWIDKLHPDDRKRVTTSLDAAIDTGKEHWSDEYRFRLANGRYADVEDRGFLIRDATGRAVRMIGGMSDITTRKNAERELAESEERWRRLVESAPLGIVVHYGGKVVYCNDAAALKLGAERRDDIVGRAVLSLVVPELRQAVQRRIQSVMETGGAAPLLEEQLLRVDGSRLDVEVAAVRCAYEGREAVQVVFLDISERKRAERRQSLMMAELDHRVKNNLATVLSIAENSLQTATSLEEFGRAFTGRVAALGRMHALLARSRWEGISLRALMEQTLEAYGHDERAEVVLDGPDHVLPARATSPLCMAMHELATNAAKYGALSTPGGRVEVRWTVTEDPPPGGVRVHIRWRESGGPTVSLPSRRGFGSTLIEELIRYELDGSATLRFAGPGVECDIEFTVAEEPERTPVAETAQGR